MVVTQIAGVLGQKETYDLIDIWHVKADRQQWTSQYPAIKPDIESFYSAFEKTYVIEGGFWVRNEDVGTHFFGRGWVSDVRSPKHYEIKTDGMTEWFCMQPFDKVFGNVHGKQDVYSKGDTLTLDSTQQLVVMDGSISVNGSTHVAPCTVKGAGTVTMKEDSACVLVTPNV